MSRRMMLLAGVLATTVAGWGRVALAEDVVHLIHTADVRGTVGICG